MELLAKNKKIKESGNDTHTLYNFGIPAYKSVTGLVTCPMAGKCADGCYATMGAYAWGNVSQAYEARLQATLQPDFSSNMIKAILPKLKTATRQNKQLVIRIHDSGDFYNIAYINKWLEVMKALPDVKFYAYTKMVPIFKRLKLPANFVVIFSEGGLSDQLIDTNDRHSRVFPDENSLISAGYDNASKDDTVAFTSKTGKIGLIYHGYKSKAWKTG